MKKIIRGFFAILFLCLTVSSVSVKAVTDDKGTWTNITNSNLNRNHISPVVALNNKIYAHTIVNNVNKIEEYNPETDKWIPKANMTSTKMVYSFQVLNNKIYAICEGDNNKEGVIEEYDPETNKCTVKSKMISSVGYKNVSIVNNKMYFLNVVLNRIEEYNPQTNRYTAKANANKSFTGNYVMEVVNNKIYVLGGTNSNKIDEYDPETDKWVAKTDMSKLRDCAKSVVVNNKIYITGGFEKTNYNESDTLTNSVEEYDPETNKCTVKTPMFSKRSWHQVVVLNNKIYAIGGTCQEAKSGNTAIYKVTNTVEEYNPETNEWTPKANMNIARNLHKAVVCDNKIYVFGGQNPESKENTLLTAEVFSQENESKNSLSISLDKNSITLLEGETNTLIATITPKDATNKKIIWTSSDESIATVDANGNVTAVKKGQAKITAKIEATDVSASCDVNVTTDGDGDSKPEINSNSGILSITLVNGITKDYDLSANEITKFTKWYDASNGKGQVRYGFNKKINPYKTVKEYIVFDKIASFEIREYNAEKQ